MKRLINYFKRLICKHKGHKFVAYAYQYGMEPTDVEMAGYCTRCGYDTHKEESQ